MASVHKTLGNYDLAAALILDAMKIRRTLNEDITPDITFLIRLHLAQNNQEKALEALIYSLMCCGADSPAFPELLSILAASFTKADTAADDFKNAIEMLNNREKLRPIMNKWAAWEKERDM